MYSFAHALLWPFICVKYRRFYRTHLMLMLVCYRLSIVDALRVLQVYFMNEQRWWCINKSSMYRRTAFWPGLISPRFWQNIIYEVALFGLFHHLPIVIFCTQFPIRSDAIMIADCGAMHACTKWFFRILHSLPTICCKHWISNEQTSRVRW